MKIIIRYIFILLVLVVIGGGAALAQKPVTADEHSLDEQRFYNTTCLAYGSDPTAFADLVTEGVIPKARDAMGSDCPFVWTRVSRSWTRLLAPFAIK